MRRLYQSVAILILSAPLSLTSLAGEKGMPQQGPHQGMGSMGGKSEEQKEQHMRAMQEHMLKMHDLMHQIQDAKDPQERERLKEEQLELMKAHRKMMKEHHRKMMQQHMQMRQGMPEEEGE